MSDEREVGRREYDRLLDRDRRAKRAEIAALRQRVSTLEQALRDIQRKAWAANWSAGDRVYNSIIESAARALSPDKES